MAKLLRKSVATILARVAQAAAEKRRADAIAREQQMKADVALQRAQLVMAEAEVAFREGNLRALDKNKGTLVS